MINLLVVFDKIPILKPNNSLNQRNELLFKDYKKSLSNWLKYIKLNILN